MAMQVGAPKSKQPGPAINVTPLVDVVLVLLIIFMVVTPLLDRKFWVHTPKQEKVEVAQRNEAEAPLVLRIGAQGELEVNGVAVTREELRQRLPRMFAARNDHVLFVAAADEVSYATVVDAMDLAREGGAVTIAPLTKPLTAAGD